MHLFRQLIPLQHFLNEFVDNKFLPTLQGKVKKDIAEATEGACCSVS